jgi:hypothetical protein
MQLLSVLVVEGRGMRGNNSALATRNTEESIFVRNGRHTTGRAELNANETEVEGRVEERRVDG